MTDERDAIEPRACVTLRLGEIDAILTRMARIENDAAEPYADGICAKLRTMRAALLRNAAGNVPALSPQLGSLDAGSEGQAIWLCEKENLTRREGTSKVHPSV